ncbi:hypothetical protein J2W35_004850 [Variovorax boronicumulans]|nr:hypothetical protein [Variovorax boronicumulans]
MTTWEAGHTDQLVEAPESLQTNFFGFNSGGKMSGLFDFVLVTADLRASEESIDGKSSIIGRILERSVDRAAADEEIAKIVEESRAKQQKVYEEKFEAQLETMTMQLNGVVASYSPGRAVTVSPAEVELKAPRTTFEVAVLDGTTETAVERQGHGFQRTLLISALQLLAQSGAASAEGVICLAIEEPELFQHPIQAQTFAKVLRSLAEDAGKRIQVTYATHSPYFLEARHFDQVRRLTRSSGDAPLVTIHFVTVADVKTKLNGVLSADTVDRQLDGIVANQLAVALFAHRAFLVEGTTESSVFYGIGDRTSLGSLEAAGVSIVPVGGKTSVPLVHAILTLIGIPVRAWGRPASMRYTHARKPVATRHGLLNTMRLGRIAARSTTTQTGDKWQLQIPAGAAHRSAWPHWPPQPHSPDAPLSASPQSRPPKRPRRKPRARRCKT